VESSPVAPTAAQHAPMNLRRVGSKGRGDELMTNFLSADQREAETTHGTVLRADGSKDSEF
jgi:hypothetical protein